MKRKRYEYYLNNEEHEALILRVKDSRYEQVGAFVRNLILEETKSVRHVNPVSFLQGISELARQVGKVGTNINQLSKHANEMALNKIVQPELADAIDEKLTDYILLQESIINKLKELIKHN